MQVRDEIKRILYCHIVPPTEEELIEVAENVGIEKHKVMDRSIINNWYHKEFTYIVEYRPMGEYLNCNCRKFEFKGILCCNIFTVMSVKDIHVVNQRYLLRRWRKYVYRRHSNIFFVGGYPHMTEEYKNFQEIERSFQECTDLSINNREKMELIKQRLVDLKNELLNLNPEIVIQWSSLAREHEATVEEGLTDGIPILNPQVTRPRGRPRTKRFISACEGNRQKKSSKSAKGVRGGRRGGKRITGKGEEMNNIDLNEPIIGTQDSQAF